MISPLMLLPPSILPLREISVMGVLIAPFALCLPLAAAATAILLAALRRLSGRAVWTRSATLELSLVVGTLSAFVLCLGRV
ncbi:hypothetical protein [Methylobacterium nonmethylotrophicum]|uniref:hypothetical protein n=1 Tax=Methylobacterium nonmethylotrophicum TaxID=1141884 RepID=UPI001436C987|nr:hypothetical protein [Methylobacterium nonmethylotrophicum]